jgi:hypothetical protein
MSYQKVYDMLNVVEKSNYPFNWTECTQCIFGIAREEGFFAEWGSSPSMAEELGLDNEQRLEIFIGFSQPEFYGRDFPTITKEEALTYCRAKVAEWEATEAIETAQKELEEVNA